MDRVDYIRFLILCEYEGQCDFVYIQGYKEDLNSDLRMG